MLNRVDPAATPIWISNLSRIVEPARSAAGADCVHIPDRGIRAGWKLFAASGRAAAVILYQPGREFVVLAALRALTPWRRRSPLILVDIVFTPPGRTLIGRLRRLMHSALWRNVDLFLVHQRDVQEICEAYALDAARFAYIPFKVNSFERAVAFASHDAGYIFSGGKSRRDFRTFCLAMKDVPYRARLVVPGLDELRPHDSSFDAALAPPNIEVLRDVSDSDWFDALARSSLVVMCIAKGSISPSGVSVYLLAMALGKPVIITEGCATRGILQNGEQAIIVPPEDPGQLAAAIRAIMEDSELRQRVARNGRAYALSLGGEETLLSNIASEVAARFS
jgi:glycosyltransferase involved in cell wall biosynthesis